MYVNADIGLAMRVALAKGNKSQSWLSRSIGISRPYISKLCNGHRTPSVDLAKKICESLGMPMSEFIEGGEE